MIADLKPYAEYRDSGLPWLGQIPGHWETRPAFGAFVSNRERNQGMKERTVLSLSYGRIVIKPAEKLHGLVPESFETYQIVHPGDIVLRTTDLQNDHTSLRVGMVRDRGIITSAYLALRTSAGVNPEFGFQFLNVWDSSKAIYGYGSGLRQSLDFSHFKRMPVAVPPPDEQVAIIKFLDWANGRLERTIRAKRKAITLLNEQKQAIIHRAVTRGLDVSVPLKSSTITTLGDIPNHWEAVKFKHLLHAPLAYGVLKPDKYSGADSVPIIRILDLANGTVKCTQLESISPQLDNEFKRTRVKQGEVIISLVGTIGRSAIIPANLSHANLSRALCRVQLRPDVSADFVIAYTQSRTFLDQADAIPAGTAQRVLNLGDLKQFWLGLPPLDEQRRIADALASETRGLDVAISHLEREIGLLREYRTRLAADLVTGKLDVREAAARLPDEVPLSTVEDGADLGGDADIADEEATA